MKLILKYVIACSSFLFSGAIVTGCMLMMPLMMAPSAMKTSQSSDQDLELLIKDAVSEMVVNRNDYTLIDLGRIETDGRILSEKKFKEIIANQISTTGQLVLTKPGHSHTLSAGMSDESASVVAVLDAELLRLESKDRLEFKMKDAKSGQIVWEKRFYSAQTSSISPHSH
jgi:hypothetical protein